MFGSKHSVRSLDVARSCHQQLELGNRYSFYICHIYGNDRDKNLNLISSSIYPFSMRLNGELEYDISF